MGANKARKTIVLAKSEAGGYGVDPTLAAATDTLLLFGNPQVVTTDFEEHVKEAIRGSETPQKSVIGRGLFNVTLPTALQWSGTTTTSIPFISDLLKACGLNESSASAGGSSSSTYTPTSQAQDAVSCAVEAYLHGLKYKALGCFGTFSLNMPAGEFNTLVFNMRGLYLEPSAAALPTPTYPIDNVVQVAEIDFSIGAYDLAAGMVCRSISLDHGGGTDERKDVNSPFGLYGIGLLPRRAILTAVVEFENDFTGRNFYNDLTAQTDVVLGFTMTSASGASKVIFAAATAQVIPPINESIDGQYRVLTVRFLLWNATDGGDYSLQFVEATS